MESQVKRLIPLLAILMASISISLSVYSQKPAPTVAKNTFATAFKLASADPELSAHAYLVKIVGEKNPLLKQRDWKPLPPASLSKLMTALVVSEHLPADDMISFSENTKNIREDGEKLSAIKSGEVLFFEDALKLLLISSANDAAVALAERLGGEEVFRRLADKKAGQLGLSNSYFLNPTGLDQAGHLTTARDLVRLSEYIWRTHPEIWEITRNLDTTVYSVSGQEYKIESTNKLLEDFPGILGGKTGFTDKAGESLILLYPVHPDKIAIIVLLRSDDRFGDARKIISWLENGF